MVWTNNPDDYEAPEGVAIERCPRCGQESIVLVAGRRVCSRQTYSAAVVGSCVLLGLLTLAVAGLCNLIGWL